MVSSEKLRTRVFLSYRREDTQHVAGRLFDLLARRLGDDQIFMDVASIEVGADFVQTISDAVRRSDVVLVLIGSRWTSVSDQHDRRRLDDPDDLVALEVGTALAHEVRVIPVLVDGAVMPPAADLPPNLRALANRQATQLRHTTFRADTDRILAAVENSFGSPNTKPEPPPGPVFPRPEVRQAPTPKPGPRPAEQAEERVLSRRRPVILQRGQPITLRVADGTALSSVKMGLGWDAAHNRGVFGNRTVDLYLDLDASVIMFAGTNPTDYAYYGQLSSDDGSIRHQGNNSSEGNGDVEMIHVDLPRVPVHITSLIFVLTSYHGHTFEQVQNTFCRLLDADNNTELARYTLAGGIPFTAVAMAKVFRVGGDWKIQAIGEGFAARHPEEAITQLGRFVEN